MTTSNNIFLLEVIVQRVVLNDPNEANNTCPLCVCVKFPELFDIIICEGDHCDYKDNGGNIETRMSWAKSCLFAVCVDDLYEVARNFRAQVAVYRRVGGRPETYFIDQPRLIAQTCVEFHETFVDVISDPDQLDKSREYIQVSK